MSAIEQGPPRATFESPLQMYAVVMGVGVCCSVAIASVYEWTRPIIRRNKIAMRQEAILEVLPGATVSAAYQFDSADGHFQNVASDQEGSDVVYAGYDETGGLVGMAVETYGMGYQDIIRLLYGYSFDSQSIIGTRVLESRETPGLGDRIESDPGFLDNFRELDVQLNDTGTELRNLIEFVKSGQKSNAWQVDGITGATISSRATAEMLRESTAYWIPKVGSRKSDFVQSCAEEQ